MVLLGFAFSMPIIKTGGLGWFGDAPRDVAIIIDASYSMAYKNGNAQIWDNAIEAARSTIEGLKERDRFCIFIARDQPEALIAEPIGNKQEGLARLKTVIFGAGSSQMAPVMEAAAQALKNLSPATKRKYTSSRTTKLCLGKASLIPKWLMMPRRNRRALLTREPVFLF